MLPETLPRSKVAVINVLARRVQRHDRMMPGAGSR
jgi:hypothetical protein